MTSFYLHETAIAEDNVTIGEGTKIWHHCHIRKGAVIGDNVNIGKGVYVDTDVVIGNNVRIQNGVSLYKGVEIEDDVFLGPHCNFTNDLFPRANSEKWQVIPTLIKEGASIGSNATIICGVTIGIYSLISVGAVVTEDTLPFSLMVGHPARLKGFVCKCGYKMNKIKSIQTFESAFECSVCDKQLKIKFEIL